jgi:alkaline phosphatase D
VPVRWYVGADAHLRRIVARGDVMTSSDRDYTVKVDVGGLRPGRVYYYGFIVGKTKSPIGRTRTLPQGGLGKLVLAAVSCSNYPAGFFNAYEALAKRKDVEYVLHLGDYIYEYGLGGYGAEQAIKLGRAPQPTNECITLADYRARYGQYRTDPDLQAAHAAFPWINVWDDHEVCNDSWMAGGENHNPDQGEGDFATRRDAAIKAYYEWIPIRPPEAGKSFLAINRAFQFGDLATLIMLETRLLARSQQIDPAKDLHLAATTWDLTNPAAPKPVPPGAPAPAKSRVLPTPFDMRGGKPVPVLDWRVASTMNPASPPPGFTFLPDIEDYRRRIADPNRALLGPAQEKWIDQQLLQSKHAGAVWQVFGNQVLMGKITFPSKAQLGPVAAAAIQQKFPQLAQALDLSAAGAPVATDSWDGYPAQRDRLFKIFDANDSNVIVLTGDSHQAWAIELYDADGKTRIGDEFGVTSITSSSIAAALEGSDVDAAKLFTAASREVKWTDPFHHGFTVLTLTKKSARADFIAVSTIGSKDYATEIAASFDVLPVKGREIGPVEKIKAA